MWQRREIPFHLMRNGIAGESLRRSAFMQFFLPSAVKETSAGQVRMKRQRQLSKRLPAKLTSKAVSRLKKCEEWRCHFTEDVG